MGRRRRVVALLATLSLLAAGALAPAAGAARAPYPVDWNFFDSLLIGLATPNAPPPGADVPGCRLGRGHPNPVILVNGTGGNERDNWGAMAPSLANAGFCVYTFNYGGLPYTGPLTAFGDIAASAGQLAQFVATVKAETGVRRVDLVGHSQGGMMPRYYLSFLGGGASVRRFVAIVPSNHGTTLDGLTNLAAADPIDYDLFDAALRLVLPAISEQLVGSSFLRKLNSVPATVPGVRYTVLTTTHDEVVTPYTSALLEAPEVTNIVVQTACPNDPVGHVGMVYDPYVVQLTINALEPAQARPAACSVGLTL